jgi:hypothetical protein
VGDPGASIRCLRGARFTDRAALLRTVQALRHEAERADHDIAVRDPRRTVTAIAGTHGGAGTTTIARLVNALDAGTSWPGPAENNLPVQVILAARTNAAGLMAASRALAGYCAASHENGACLAGFILTADAPGRLPKDLNRRISILASVTMVFRMPWVNEWRLCEVTPVPRRDWPVLISLLAFVKQATQDQALATSEQQRGD